MILIGSRFPDFFLKKQGKFQSILLCWLRLTSFIFGVACVNFALLSECLVYLFWMRFWNKMIFCFEFLSGAFYFCFDQTIAKWVALFLCLPKLLYFVLNFSCAVRNFLLIYLLRVSIFAIACVIPLLPYFLQYFCALFTWFWCIVFQHAWMRDTWILVN